MSITEQKLQSKTELNSIEDAINDIRLGKVVVVVMMKTEKMKVILLLLLKK